MSIDLAQYRQLYVEESLEGIEVVESGLLRMGREGGAGGGGEIVHDIFRAIHSIKGGSGTFQLTRVTALSHVMETLLDEVRSGQREATQESIELLLSGCDRLRLLLEAAARGRDDVEAGEIAARLAAFLEATSPSRTAGSVGAAPAPATALPGAAASGWRVRFAPFSSLMKSGNDPLRLLRELARLGPLEARLDASRLPLLEAHDPESCQLAWDLALRAPVERAAVSEVFSWVDGECELRIEPLEAAPVAPQPAAAAETAAAPRSPQQQPAGGDAASMRVAIDKVDALVNLVGELVITQSILGQISRDIDPFTQQRLRKGLEQLERNTRELQESVMRIRMLPIRFTFNRYHRLVHDLGAQLGKSVELHLAGEQTELDRTVLEKISDPLMHLVRNCIDHGLETPERRRALGKPEAGRLDVTAEHRGGNIIIQVKDDGAGIDRDKVLRHARARGIVGENESLTEEQVNELIFRPGFSTADVVSEVSGRGVGMDVVLRNIQSLGGNLAVTSVPGRGTTFTIRLPLTMAILEAQMVRVGGAVYIFPLVSIVESIQLRPEKVQRIANAVEMYPVRGEWLPILRLRELLRLTGERSVPKVDGELLVLVEGDGRQVGLVVDDLLEQQQVVIKSLEANFERVRGISGATILGDGTVALILDVAALIQMALSQGVVNDHGTRDRARLAQ